MNPALDRGRHAGRDAADVSLATIFGNVLTTAPSIVVDAVPDAAAGQDLPRHMHLALSGGQDP